LSKQVKYVVITGGVLSGLGKGVVSASIGKLLSDKYKIVPIKCDGYLNVDPGTMNPIEHGEVFVLDDGGEVDLDFGHYERFMNINCKTNWNLTSGKIFLSLVEKERRGDFLGKTVQVIPHVTGEIRDRWTTIADEEKADILLIEIGGTVGDIENLWYLEAARELIRFEGKENVTFVHLGLIPEVDENKQQKTKPMQQSINHLREHGIFPDIVVGRSPQYLHEKTKLKLHWISNIDKDAVISDPNCEFVYELPLVFQKEGLAQKLPKIMNIDECEQLGDWSRLVENMKHPQKTITVAICGKYTELQDSYISIVEALRHAGAHLGVQIQIKWLETTNFEQNPQSIQEAFTDVDAMIVPGGFGTRGTEGKIAAIRYAREKKLPFLGICYGLQLAIIEYARTICRLEGANSAEIDENAPHLVVDILPEQKGITAKGATMRLGSYQANLKPETKIAQLYKKLLGDDQQASERHRHRYEVNPEYHKLLLEKGIIFSGLSPDGKLVEFFELPDHPYFVGTQGHPELKSRLEYPAPLFYGLVEAAIHERN
jgi:CTP synthase